MSKQPHAPSGVPTTNQDEAIVRLEGGPVDLPEELRVRPASAAAEKIKIQHRGGHEHFERTDVRIDTGSRTEIVFRWTMRTRIAE